MFTQLRVGQSAEISVPQCLQHRSVRMGQTQTSCLMNSKVILVQATRRCVNLRGTVDLHGLVVVRVCSCAQQGAWVENVPVMKWYKDNCLLANKQKNKYDINSSNRHKNLLETMNSGDGV